MGIVHNLIGQRFGRWTVLQRSETTEYRAVMWLCQCDCGRIAVVAGGNLTLGRSKSCGCLKRELVGKRISKLIRNRPSDLHPKWLGDNAKSGAIHTWLRRNKSKPEFCECCRERPATELSYNGKNGEWSRNLSDYEYLCKSCHKLKDFEHGALPLTKVRVHRIREFYTTKAATQRELSRLFKVSKSTIQSITSYKGVYCK